jgi:hypothetical protein
MSKQFVITFGPSDKTVDGDSLDDVKTKLVAELTAQNGKLTSEQEEFYKGQVLSQVDGEKALLKTLCETFASQIEPSLESSMEMTDIIRDIKDVKTEIKLTKSEIDRIVKAYPKLPPQRVIAFMRYTDLLAQLKTPVPEKDLEVKKE